MKKILFTGGAGYIGSHTIHYFLKNGYSLDQLIVFDNLKYGHRESLPEGIQIIKGDLLNVDAIEEVFIKNEIESVLHFAAYAYVGESMKNPSLYFNNNVNGGLNLLESMRKHSCNKIVFSSSCAIYGQPEYLPIDEESVKKPINPYGESKLIFERYLHWYDQIYGIKSISMRYFNAAGAAYGIGELHDPETHLIPLIFDVVFEKTKEINVFGNSYSTKDGTCIRDYIHVLDLAEGHLKALEYLKKTKKSNYFNLGTGKGNSILEIIRIIEEVSKKNIRINFCKERLGDPAILVANPDKAEKLLDWKAKKNMLNIIQDVFDWQNHS
ncbi:ADP-L-glycero-D-manno-heptose-6-epimerase [Candidatus Lokiarchaeum ossiferum]|uniref:ADP-L-glycero-D-manno-heptose-6-epimerase n=1 Tax=Candidatus Lokiarchaeum ossiferum TaxID=2951803 RepID=A0ABY6HZG9_9ARCH|nr:ADP-L-glycero-D-manno-heptose-6-epimerase [Candidatus Lokiarchaeum sp. B-35]